MMRVHCRDVWTSVHGLGVGGEGGRWVEGQVVDEERCVPGLVPL